MWLRFYDTKFIGGCPLTHFTSPRFPLSYHSVGANPSGASTFFTGVNRLLFIGYSPYYPWNHQGTVFLELCRWRGFALRIKDASLTPRSASTYPYKGATLRCSSTWMCFLHTPHQFFLKLAPGRDFIEIALSHTLIFLFPTHLEGPIQ